MPELATIFSQRIQCGERNPERAHSCAVRLGLTEKELPTLGKYVQEQRRAKLVPQIRFAQQAGIDLQALRDLELNKLDPTKLPQRILERIANALSAPVEYLIVLAKLTSQAGSPRQGTVFARTLIARDERSESQQ
jgi:transcriptional regulator with XRE-family HTH domain